MKFKPWLGIFGAMAVTIAGYVGFYSRWKRKEMLRLQAESCVIETELGPVEYRMGGTGPAVLIAHGSPGGYDQGFAFSRLIGSQQLTYIAISRPGYLRTPLATGATPEAQADLYAALLDALDIEQAAIIAISGGGPSALQFVLRHPAHCRGLVMVSAVTQRYCEQEAKQHIPLLKRLFNQLYNKLSTFDPFLYFILPFTKLQPGEHTSEDLVRSVIMYHLRKTGYDNDIQQFAIMPRYPLEQITTPTFVVHATADDEVPFADAELLAREVSHTKLLAIKGGNHMVFYTHAATIMPALRVFLENLQ